MTRGTACPTPNCKVRMHFHCFNTFRRRNNACPSCSKEWPRDAKDKQLIPVGEDAAQEGDDRRRRARTADDEESDEEDVEEPLTQDSPPKKATRSRGKQRATQREDSEEVDEDEDTKPIQPTQNTQRTRRSARH